MIILSSFTIFKAVQPFAAQMEGHYTFQALTEKPAPSSLTHGQILMRSTHSRPDEEDLVQIKLQKGDDEPIENQNSIKRS